MRRCSPGVFTGHQLLLCNTLCWRAPIDLYCQIPSFRPSVKYNFNSGLTWDLKGTGMVVDSGDIKHFRGLLTARVRGHLLPKKFGRVCYLCYYQIQQKNSLFRGFVSDCYIPVILRFSSNAWPSAGRFFLLLFWAKWNLALFLVILGSICCRTVSSICYHFGCICYRR